MMFMVSSGLISMTVMVGMIVMMVMSNRMMVIMITIINYDINVVSYIFSTRFNFILYPVQVMVSVLIVTQPTAPDGLVPTTAGRETTWTG